MMIGAGCKEEIFVVMATLDEKYPKNLKYSLFAFYGVDTQEEIS